MTDKKNVLSKLGTGELAVLELGCGNRKRYPGSIGIDVLDYPAVDLVGDICEVLKALPDASIRCIYAYHVLEHIAELEDLMRQASRVLAPGAIFDIVTPHFSNAYYYSDPTHKRFFGLYTMSYLAEDRLLKRKVPHYQTNIDFEVKSIDLRFKSTPPFYLRHAVRRAFGFIFNATRYTQEFYEENLTGLVSCYELHYVLQKKA